MIRRTRRRLGAVAIAGLATAALAVPAAAAAADRNNDNIPDRWERQHGLSLKVNQARKDQDRDGLRNRNEFRGRFDPRDDDSDDDGVEDGDEGAGTIESFDAATGRLVITVFNGDSVSGLVDGDTEIECDEEGDDHSGDHHGDDDSRDSGSGHDGSDDDGVGDDDSSGPGGHGDDEGDEEDCGPEALVAGAVVQEAELEIQDGASVWDEIELLEQAPATP